MTIARITSQDAAGTAATTSVSANWPATPTQNHLLIAFVYANVAASVVAMSGWTNVRESVTGASAANGIVGVWWKVAGASEATTVTATATGATVMRLHIYEYSGTATSSPTDGSVANTTGSSSTTSFPAGSSALTITNADDLLVGVWGFSGTTSLWSVDSSFSLLQTNARMAGADRIPAATGTYNPAMTWANSNRAGSILVAFKGLATVVTATLATASALAQAPTVTGDANVSPPAATATAAAATPALAVDISTTAVAATGTGQAVAPTLTTSSELQAIVAAATAQMYAPTVTGDASVTALPAAATATALVPGVGLSAVVNAAKFTATAAGLAPTATTGSAVDVTAASATAAAVAPTVAVASTVTAARSTASAQALAPSVTGAVDVAAATATASAALTAPGVSVSVVVSPPTRRARARAHAPLVFSAVHHVAEAERLGVVAAENRYAVVPYETRTATA